MTKEDRQATSRGERRILYVSDPSSIATNLFPDPVREEDLRRWVDMLADSGVDTFNQEVYSQGWTCYWRSDKVQYDQRLQHRRFIPLLDAGTQPLEVLIDQSRQRGLSFIAGFRVNDDHAYAARQQGVGVAAFIDANPQWRLTEFPPGDYYKMAEPLDFTFEEVREFIFNVIAEVAIRFDVDGVELCFRDMAYFPAGRGGERAHLMTGLVRNLRAMLDAQGKEKGKKLLLGARVYSTLDECGRLGLDVPAWITGGLIDYVSPGDVMFTDFNMPLGDFAALTRGTQCKLYPGMLPWTSSRARNRLDQIPLDSAACRAFAQTVYGAGGDGISPYNYCCIPWHAPFIPQSMQIFHELRDPRRVGGGERHYIFDPTWAGQTGFGAEGKCSTGAVKAQRITLDRQTAQADGRYRFRLYEDLERAHVATLLFRGFGLTEDDELAVRLNDQPIAPSRIGRTRASDAPIDWHHVRPVDGRLCKCIPEQGRIDFRTAREPAFSTRWFLLEKHHVVRGENVLTIALTRRDASSADPIVIDEVEIWVQPKVTEE